ncbi:hypothetical protein D3C81_1141370 [compost metagenome]
MRKLLWHVEAKLYDGVVVVDIDRLGRGENKDWSLIKDTFWNSETGIITPSKITIWKRKMTMYRLILCPSSPELSIKRLSAE